MRSSVIIHSYTYGKPIFSFEDRVLFSGFISAIDSIAKEALKSNIEMIKLGNSKIYINGDNQFLYILIIADYESLDFPNKFFTYTILDLKQLDITHTKIFSAEITQKMDTIISANLSKLLELA